MTQTVEQMVANCVDADYRKKLTDWLYSPIGQKLLSDRWEIDYASVDEFGLGMDKELPDGSHWFMASCYGFYEVKGFDPDHNDEFDWTLVYLRKTGPDGRAVNTLDVDQVSVDAALAFVAEHS